MYITVSRKPSIEEISLFNMKVSEEDSIADYRIDLTALSEEIKQVLCESYNLVAERLVNATKIVLSYNNEV